MEGRKVVIVGGVAGGASAAARLRRLDENAQIILLERGDYISYANCGLPYHVGGVIKSREALLVQRPEGMRDRYNIDVRTGSEAISIDRAAKTVQVKRKGGTSYEESYDTLILATGSSPLRPPIPGIDSSRVLSLWTIPDADRIRELIREGGVKQAVVVGGGFIGLEMAENLHKAGVKVRIAEMLDQVMAPLDYEMAQLLHENLEANGVELHLGDGVDSFKDTEKDVVVRLKSGTELHADLVLLAIGVKPNSSLAKDAGLTVNNRGGVVVDQYLRTSDPDIYAVGDVIEVEDFVSKQRTMIPLAGPANKQGRIAANNICGASEVYAGTQGTSVAQVFDLVAATTGANEKTLLARGMVLGKDYERIIITQNAHAGYYPGASPLTLKLLFSIDGKQLFGAQIVGADGVDKRIDTIAVTMRLGGGIEAIKTLELAYAPPFSSAKDPVNMAGFVAENVLSGYVRLCAWNALEENPDAVVLDVRENAEHMAFSFEGGLNIPLGQLRSRLGELDKEKQYVVFCAVGVRSYNAAKLLMNHGFNNVYVYPGGTRFYRSTHYKQAQEGMDSTGGPIADSGQPQDDVEVHASIHIDCSGLQCPGPILKVFETMSGMNEGDVMEVTATDPGFTRDIQAWCRRTGNTLLSNQKEGHEYVALIRKGIAAVSAQKHVQTAAGAEGKTIIVFSGDLDKVLASFIIANGAAAMGRPVTMFFTFWGLNVLRKSDRQRVKKSPVERMFGAMMPRGMGKLKLSKLNMGGLGTAMMRRVMKDKRIDSLEDLVKKAMAHNVKIVACTMSMDVMGIREEELIDGVELAGVGAYLGDAEESNVNLFI